MTRKEKIILAALELSSKYGLKAVSLSQIAEKVGIKKPSLYNHFDSKEALVKEMYSFVREQSKNQTTVYQGDFALLFEGKSLEEILTAAMESYLKLVSNKQMLCFFKVIYSERTTDPAAAKIMLEETRQMISYIKNLFYALAVHGKMRSSDIDTAAMSYAMTIHALVDNRMDMMTAGEVLPSDGNDLPEEIKNYIRWFSNQMGVDENE